MRWVLVLLCMLGIVAASLALREHYREDTSPCSINERWDCGIVNHSPFAVFHGVPVAVIGIAGYFVMGALAVKRAFRLMLVAALAGLGYSLYLAYIEKYVLGMWCIYCVISLGIVSLVTVLVAGTVVARAVRRSADQS